ncbi:MAG: hypothetical protein E7191_00840 [Erysipelotrichaceae bacterium]|nr:hypothetical protein [Erysipelotrichaceae bacterium]
MGNILIILSAICFSLSGTWVVLLKEYNLDVYTLTAFRLAFSVIFSAIAIKYTNNNFIVSYKELRDLSTFGLGGVATLLLYSAAAYHIPSGLVCLLNFCYPIIVALFSFLLYKEKIGKWKIIASALMMIGLIMISGGGSMNFMGFILGLLSAVTFSIYVLAQEHSTMSKIHGLKIVFYTSLIGFILITFSLIGFNKLLIPTVPYVYFISAIGALITQVGANTCLALGMQKGVSSTKASFLAIIEPAFALIWDKVLFNVSLSTISMIGILIIFSSFFITLKT